MTAKRIHIVIWFCIYMLRKYFHDCLCDDVSSSEGMWHFLLMKGVIGIIHLSAACYFLSFFSFQFVAWLHAHIYVFSPGDMGGYLVLNPFIVGNLVKTTVIDLVTITLPCKKSCSHLTPVWVWGWSCIYPYATPVSF